MNKLMNVRIGNSFPFLWQVDRYGEPFDLSQVTDMKMICRSRGIARPVEFTLDDEQPHILRIDVTSEIADSVGIHNFELQYVLNDPTLSLAMQKRTIDIDAFYIVDKSAKADKVSEMVVTSDIAIAMKGKDGKDFTFDMFTEVQKNELFNKLQAGALTSSVASTTEYNEITI